MSLGFDAISEDPIAATPASGAVTGTITSTLGGLGQSATVVIPAPQIATGATGGGGGVLLDGRRLWPRGPKPKGIWVRSPGGGAWQGPGEVEPPAVVEEPAEEPEPLAIEVAIVQRLGGLGTVAEIYHRTPGRREHLGDYRGVGDRLATRGTRLAERGRRGTIHPKPRTMPQAQPQTRSAKPRGQSRFRAEERARAELLAKPRPFRTAWGNKLYLLAPQAFEVDFSWGGVHPTYRAGAAKDIAVVCISGPLEHHASWQWDSYERIVCAVEKAMSPRGADMIDAYEAENWWKADYKPLAPADCIPARCVVLRIDSPGGEAAGTMSAHRKLRALSQQYNVPIYAYADETMCSAAYAIGSAAQEIWGADTSQIGSIGVVATIFDRTVQNEQMGLKVELITSGEFKADGHADRPLTDGIRGRMQARVDALAGVFFEIVAEARGTTVEAVADLEAGVFTGPEAEYQGVADGIADWDEFIALLDDAPSVGPVNTDQQAQEEEP